MYYQYHVDQFGMVLWYYGMVLLYATMVWYYCMVLWYGTMVLWYGTMVWYYGTMVWDNVYSLLISTNVMPGLILFTMFIHNKD